MNASDLAHSLKEARLSAGLNKTDVERQTGVTRKSVGMYESGETSPSIGTLLTLLACYGLSDVAAVILGLDVSKAQKLHGVPVTANA